MSKKQNFTDPDGDEILDDARKAILKEFDENPAFQIAAIKFLDSKRKAMEGNRCGQ